jgi:hypothetical protein
MFLIDRAMPSDPSQAHPCFCRACSLTLLGQDHWLITLPAKSMLTLRIGSSGQQVHASSGVYVKRLCGARHGLRGDHHFLDAFEARQVEHGVEQDTFHDRAQTPRTGLRSMALRAMAPSACTLATPEPIKDWSLTSLKEKLIKIGAKVVSHGRYVVFQMAEIAIPRQMFQEILRLIAELRPQPPPTPA